MLKLLKATVFLAGLMQASADAAATAGCALDGASAVSEVSDAAVFLWAATQRCTSGSASGGNPLAPRCTVDIASALQAINNMVMVIVKAAKDCGDFQAESYSCGMAVGKLTGASAGLTAGIAGMTHSCPLGAPSSGSPGLGVNDNTASLIGQCFIDAKQSVTSLFKASNTLSNLGGDCAPGSKACARKALSVVSFFSDMGSAMANAANHCGTFDKKNYAGSSCAGAVLHSVSTLSAIANAAVGVAQSCAVAPSRLYEMKEEQEAAGTPTSMMAMMALLPLGAVLGFVGSKYAKTRTMNPVSATDADQEALVLDTDSRL